MRDRNRKRATRYTFQRSIDWSTIGIGGVGAPLPDGVSAVPTLHIQKLSQARP